MLATRCSTAAFDALKHRDTALVRGGWRASDDGRWKRVIGDGLRFHTDVAQAVEVLNRMLDLRRPNSVRVA